MRRARASRVGAPRSIWNQWPGLKAPPVTVFGLPSIRWLIAIVGTCCEELLACHWLRGGRVCACALEARAANSRAAAGRNGKNGVETLERSARNVITDSLAGSTGIGRALR